MKANGRFLLLTVLLAGRAAAQVPDFRVRADISLAYNQQRDHDETLRLYSPLGRPSTVALTLFLETGFNVVLSERLQRLPGNVDTDIFDEAFIEDPGIWRVGKQYLPFGTGRLLRESVPAARADTNLIAESAPIEFAVANGGQGRQNGVVLRIGRALGASAAVGENFGLSPTALTVVRRPEDAPDPRRGWKRAFGVDGTRHFGNLTATAEAVSLSGGRPDELTVFDFEGNYYSNRYVSVGAGWSSASGAINGSFLRFFGSVYARRNVTVEPLLRFRNGSFFDASLTLRVRF